MTPSQLQDQLEDSLEELEEGIDVLSILDRAYQSTLKAHVVPPSTPPRTESPPAKTSLTSPSSFPYVPLSSSPTKFPPPPPLQEQRVPLLAGSSTALLAVLDHVPRRHTTTAVPSSEAVKDSSDLSPSQEYDAVVKIAHVGDCMGMLVRDEEIAWRSEEMWWSVGSFYKAYLYIKLILFITVQYSRATRAYDGNIAL